MMLQTSNISARMSIVAIISKWDLLFSIKSYRFILKAAIIMLPTWYPSFLFLFLMTQCSVRATTIAKKTVKRDRGILSVIEIQQLHPWSQSYNRIQLRYYYIYSLLKLRFLSYKKVKSYIYSAIYSNINELLMSFTSLQNRDSCIKVKIRSILFPILCHILCVRVVLPGAERGTMIFRRILYF